MMKLGSLKANTMAATLNGISLPCSSIRWPKISGHCANGCAMQHRMLHCNCALSKSQKAHARLRERKAFRVWVKRECENIRQQAALARRQDCAFGRRPVSLDDVAQSCLAA